jgi:hypothetical protein
MLVFVGHHYPHSATATASAAATLNATAATIADRRGIVLIVIGRLSPAANPRPEEFLRSREDEQVQQNGPSTIAAGRGK